MRRANLAIRAVALIGAASAAVHELRYAIGYGAGATRALAAHPHGYLSVVLPGVLTAVFITVTGLGMRLAGGRRTVGARHIGLARLWTVCALALAIIFATQETLEGSGALLHGGWIGLALAVPIGLVVALALRGANAAEELRSRGPALLTQIATAAPLAARAAVFHAQRTPAPLGARGPPFAFAS